MNEGSAYIMLSGLQHFAFCPRQFALIHVEQVWIDNRSTAEGKIRHETVDSPSVETRKNLRYERSVEVVSSEYRIKGRLDLLEIHLSNPKIYVPVEYKLGKPKVEDWDRIQLCAQALCLEEMRGIQVQKGAIWYWKVRRRETVHLDCQLRKRTVETILNAHRVYASRITPTPKYFPKKCAHCSLHELCQPKTFEKDWSSRYLNSIE